MYISGQVLVKAHSIGDMVVIFILFHFLVIAAEPVYASNESQPQMVVVTQPLPQVQVKFGEQPVDIVCSNCQNSVKVNQ